MFPLPVKTDDGNPGLPAASTISGFRIQPGTLAKQGRKGASAVLATILSNAVCIHLPSDIHEAVQLLLTTACIAGPIETDQRCSSFPTLPWTSNWCHIDLGLHKVTIPRGRRVYVVCSLLFFFGLIMLAFSPCM